MSEEDFLCRFAGYEFIMLVSDKDKASVTSYVSDKEEWEKWI